MVKGVKLKSQENLSKLIFVIFNAHPIKTVQCHCTLQVFYDVKECLAKYHDVNYFSKSFIRIVKKDPKEQ